MSSEISEQRKKYSIDRLSALKGRLNNLDELKIIPNLAIFGAGSFARLEASEYSDIDMFFLSNAKAESIIDPSRNSLRMFGKMIETVEGMGFPKFSNDCEYLSIIHAEDIRKNLGSRTDDHLNYFTVRLLLLLESHCLFGNETFNEITNDIIDSYFRDFPNHQDAFQPIFLFNDIGRYWKTILLNYENKRVLQIENQDTDKEKEKKRIKHKVKNFKVKFSRMTICFASIAALGTAKSPITREVVFEMTKLTPRQRLESVAQNIPLTQKTVTDILNQYDWFLEMTGKSTEELEENFKDKNRKKCLLRQIHMVTQCSICSNRLIKKNQL